jgi:hypothetical protein
MLGKMAWNEHNWKEEPEVVWLIHKAGVLQEMVNRSNKLLCI